MQRRILYLIPALLAGTLIQARAATIACSLQTGDSGPFVTQACNQPLVAPTAALNWGTVLSASSNQVLGPIMTAVDGDPLTISSTDTFAGVDNTDLTWNGSSWVQAWQVNPNIATYGGQFSSTTQAGGPPPEPVLGDNLLEIKEPGGISNANTTATLAFQQTLAYIGFQVTNVSGMNLSFTAELVAYDASNNVLGTYMITDTGGGGQCPTLEDLNGPEPCNDAPLLQFFDPENNIASVELIMSDSKGVLLDTLDVAFIPEPSSFALFGIGILGLVFAARRGYVRRGLIWGSARD